MERAGDGSEILDVAIVGAGISGLYTGWRLLREADDRARIVVFEREAARLGGRLLSVTPPEIPDTRLELGGMRFTSTQKRASGLIDHLGLAKDPFPVDRPQNIAYLRGRHLRRRDLTDPDLVPYDLAPDERGAQALSQGFTVLAAQRLVRTMLGKDRPLNDVDWKALAARHSYEGESLRDLPLEYVLRRNISQEAFRFAQDTSGYDSILHTWNAADGLPWNLEDFGASPTFFHLHDGFESLPYAIADRFEQAGGEIRKAHDLAGFDRATLPDGSEGVVLRFRKGEPDAGDVPPVMARRLVLAMPRRSLERLDPTGPVLGPDAAGRKARRLIEAVEPIPLFKLALCYSYPWWRTIEPMSVQNGDKVEPLTITDGQSVTDIPLRQCYYWATDSETQNSVLLIYDDGTDLAFWAGLRDIGKLKAYASGRPTPGKPRGSQDWYNYQAPALMVDEAHRQLCIMHGVADRTDIPKPYAAAYKDWGDEIYGGGANFWRLNEDSPVVFDDILQPNPDAPVFICGEAYSNFQGWVEGALETADAMLKKHFGLGAPEWSREHEPRS
ncbi:flavin monoamine oxidase family protein [Lichenibacterium dinghuense]|uniref:flavin monoamine oxidase family protein n=1 Tax=Lichenibacterium dinghuense TaxID=2895977 RepID=UPI001F24EC26|nr:FAD-dependent oxidoreductase [Lichenibacterium sp. 6Y81]